MIDFWKLNRVFMKNVLIYFGLFIAFYMLSMIAYDFSKEYLDWDLSAIIFFAGIWFADYRRNKYWNIVA